MRIHHGVRAALLVAAAACTTAEGKSIESLEKVPVVGLEGLFQKVDSVMLVTPAEEAIGMASGVVVLPGSIIVSDVTRGSLKVFNRQGRLLRTIGKPGDGPGEFRMPIGMFQNDRGHVVVFDLRRSVLSTWDTTGALLGERVMPGTWDGLTDLPGTDHVLMVGARVRKGHEAGASGEQMALHDVDSSGAITTSYHSFKWPGDPLQSTFTHYFATTVGDRLVTGAFASNRVFFVNRHTGEETSALIGGPWYRTPRWSKQPPGQSAGQRVDLWARQQVLMLHLFSIDDGRFLAQFRSYTQDGEEEYRYVLADTAGVSLVSTAPTPLRILSVVGNTAYGVVTTAEGDVALETIKLMLPARPASASVTARSGPAQP